MAVTPCSRQAAVNHRRKIVFKVPLVGSTDQTTTALYGKTRTVLRNHTLLHPTSHPTSDQRWDRRSKYCIYKINTTRSVDEQGSTASSSNTSPQRKYTVQPLTLPSIQIRTSFNRSAQHNCPGTQGQDKNSNPQPDCTQILNVLISLTRWRCL